MFLQRRQRTLLPATTPLPFARRRGLRLSATVSPPPAVSDLSLDAVQRALGGQVTVGGVAGFATGYAVKRIGQVLMVVVGLEIVALQMMSKRGWVSVDWKAIGDELSPHVEKERLDRAVDAFRYKMPFAGAFSAGCLAGLKWG